MTGATIFDRLRDLDSRLRALEASAGSGLSGTDQTIKGSHDRLDALLGAAVAAPTELKLTGADSGVVMTHIARKQLVDNTATGVFTITTANETGDNDAGGYSCYVLATPSHGLSAVTTTNAATKGYLGAFSRAAKNTGDGALSAVKESIETDPAATDAAARDVGAVTMTATETSEYVTQVEFAVDVTGTATVNPFINCLVVVVWHTYTTPPIIAAL